MKRLLPVLICCLARLAAAQVTPTAQSSTPPDNQPQSVEVHGDGRCIAVRPGDTVHYTLTIENIGASRALFGDLRLRLGHGREFTTYGDMLPAPDFRSLGGGGVGKQDAGEGKMYHFAFKVPKEIYGGTYRGVEVTVRADQPEPEPVYPMESQHMPKVGVTRHTRDEVRRYCLNVISNFGVARARPAVTNFEPGQVDLPPPTAPQPAPLPH